MSLRDTLRAALTSPIGKVLDDLGSTVDVYRKVPDEYVEEADGSSNAAWLPATQGVTMLLTELSRLSAERYWGPETTARFRALLKEADDLKLRDGVVVKTGGYVGQRFIVVEERHSDLGTTRSLGLERTEDDFDGAV